VYCVAFSPTGQRLASAGRDGTVRIWDAASGKCVQTFRGHNDSVNSVAFSPDDQYVVSASEMEVKVWNTASGDVAVTLGGHTGNVRRVAFSHDGQRLASASWDHTVRIWDATPLEKKSEEPAARKND